MRRLALAPAAVLVSVAATGWLYLVRPALPGPKVGMALPLDELARTSSAPLLWFAAVWAVAGVAIGVAARWARIDRLAAAVGLALAVGVWTYVVDGVSIAVTRQIPMREAFDAAAGLRAVYLPAAIVAVCGALLATSYGRGRRAPLVVAFLVFAGGALELTASVLPGHNTGLVGSLAPDAVGPFARAAHVPIALALLLAARGLARRRLRAWQLATALAAASVTLHVLHGFNQGTLASVATLVVLLAWRHAFDRPGDPTAHGRALARLAVAAAAIGAYAFGALWINRLDADQPFTAAFAARELATGVLGIHVAGSPHLSGFFGDWYPLSLLLLAVAGLAWVVAGWLAPWRYRHGQEARERALARELVQAWGSDTLAPFVLRADKSYFFADDERALLAYRVVGGVAIVSGDPVGPPEALPALLERFVEFAHRRDWRVAVLGASERQLDLYRGLGLQALYHGDEAVVDVQRFSLEGRAIRKVRQSVHRLEHAGYRIEVLRAEQGGGELRADLEGIADEWRGAQPERGFAMEYASFWEDGESVLVIGRDPAGRPDGFLHFAVSPACASLSLSSMPRRRSTPNGFNEWLIVEAIEWARRHAFESVSLNFAPFAALLAPEAELTGLQEVQRRALHALKGRFQLDNLLLFNRKFLPRWERRYLVYERRLDLPRVGIAALAAEAYLPFQTARR